MGGAGQLPLFFGLPRAGGPTYVLNAFLFAYHLLSFWAITHRYRRRLWKVEVQRLADTTRLKVTVCHFPPGTSKWNKVEHRLFSHISMNWRGQLLTSHEVVVNLIGATKTRSGLEVQARLDSRKYPTKIQVSDEEMEQVKIRKHKFHGEWNYTVAPH